MAFWGEQIRKELRPCPCPRPQSHHPQTPPLNPHGRNSGPPNPGTQGCITAPSHVISGTDRHTVPENSGPQTAPSLAPLQVDLGLRKHQAVSCLSHPTESPSREKTEPSPAHGIYYEYPYSRGDTLTAVGRLSCPSRASEIAPSSQMGN